MKNRNNKNEWLKKFFFKSLKQFTLLWRQISKTKTKKEEEETKRERKW